MAPYTQLTPGTVYTLRNQSKYLCLDTLEPELPGMCRAILQRESDGYTLIANGTRMNADGSIEWDYSTGGHFAND